MHETGEAHDTDASQPLPAAGSDAIDHPTPLNVAANGRVAGGWSTSPTPTQKAVDTQDTESNAAPRTRGAFTRLHVAPINRSTNGFWLRAPRAPWLAAGPPNPSVDPAAMQEVAVVHETPYSQPTAGSEGRSTVQASR